MVILLSFVLIVDDEWNIETLKEDFESFVYFLNKNKHRIPSGKNSIEKLLKIMSTIFTNPFTPSHADVMMPTQEELTQELPEIKQEPLLFLKEISKKEKPINKKTPKTSKT